jgi:hypothetical protein
VRHGDPDPGAAFAEQGIAFAREGGKLGAVEPRILQKLKSIDYPVLIPNLFLQRELNDSSA